MKSRKTDSDAEQFYDGEPNVAGLAAAYRTAVDQRDGNYWERQRINYQARYCVWDHQTWDGRKGKRRDNKRPFPWLGASDARVALVDKYIREDAALLMQIWETQKLLVRPTKPAMDAGWANRVTALLRWLVYEEMDEAPDEAALLANTFLERGAAALGIWWCKEERLTRETVEMKQLVVSAKRALQAMAQGQGGDALELQARLPDLIADPDLEGEVANIMAEFVGPESPLTPKRLRKLVRDLRETGIAHFPRAIVTKDRPIIRALVWNEDIVLPAETTDVQRSRQIFIRELVTEADLKSRVGGYSYAADWVDKVIESQRGRMVMDPETTSYRMSALGRGEEDTSKLYEIVSAYETLYDQDGIPGIYVTTFSPALCVGKDAEESWGKHELLDYAHNEMPVIAFATERRSRLIDDSRGYGERAYTWQQGIKRQWDARSDRSDVATLPPSYHPPDESPDAWGPGVTVPTSFPDKYGYFEAPRFDMGSQEIEETIRKFSDEYFGRPVDEQNSVEAQVLKAELVRGWLRGWKRATTQVLQLSQQYLPDETFIRVVGSEQGRTLRVTREEIQGPFNVTLKANAADFDAEFVKEKLGLMQQAMAFDVSGRLDRDELLIAAMELIDPSYAERLIKPGDSAALEQIDDEQSVLAKLLLGIGVDVRGDEAFQLRKQVLERTIAQSPTVQGLLKVNPQAKELVLRRLEQLDFNIQQKLVNPDIGRRLGTQPMSAAAGPAPAAKPQAVPATPASR